MSAFKKYFDSIKNACTQLTDRDNFLYALERIQTGKKDGELILAKIYEKGNSFVHKDRASAYALYYIAAEKGFKEAQSHLNDLRHMLAADDWQRAQKAISNLRDQSIH